MLGVPKGAKGLASRNRMTDGVKTREQIRAGKSPLAFVIPSAARNLALLWDG